MNPKLFQEKDQGQYQNQPIKKRFFYIKKKTLNYGKFRKEILKKMIKKTHHLNPKNLQIFKPLNKG